MFELQNRTKELFFKAAGAIDLKPLADAELSGDLQPPAIAFEIYKDEITSAHFGYFVNAIDLHFMQAWIKAPYRDAFLHIETKFGDSRVTAICVGQLEYQDYQEDIQSSIKTLILKYMTVDGDNNDVISQPPLQHLGDIIKQILIMAKLANADNWLSRLDDVDELFELYETYTWAIDQCFPHLTEGSFCWALIPSGSIDLTQHAA